MITPVFEQAGQGRNLEEPEEKIGFPAGLPQRIIDNRGAWAGGQFLVPTSASALRISKYFWDQVFLAPVPRQA